MNRTGWIPLWLALGLPTGQAGCLLQEYEQTGPFVAEGLDVLFVIDNSRSMVGEQVALARSFDAFTAVLDESFGRGNVHIAVVTTGMQSDGCGPCPRDQPDFYSCTNPTGEAGRLQDRLGRNVGDLEEPVFEFTSDPSCRVIDSASLERCFFDPGLERGVALVGVNGCGYEKGLAPLEAALSEPLLSGWNAGFLRPKARLAVVVLSDEEDCGEVGDVTENLQGVSGNVCYYAAHGSGPDGSTRDREGRAYRLTPVGETYDFLMQLKDGQPGGVRFAAIVGVADPADPLGTAIEFESAAPNARVRPACSTPGCTSAAGFCEAYPGTRYLALAERFGLGTDGFVDTICQADFGESLTRLATFLAWEQPAAP